MKVRWTTPARDDLADIARYIGQDDKAAAQHVRKAVANSIALLSTLPYRGRVGEVRGTYELIFAPWPYIAVYEIYDTEVIILHLRHTAQSWP